MPRFFVHPSAVQDEMIYLEAADIKHIKVLRMGPEEQFTVCDGQGWDYQCRLLPGDTAEIVARVPSAGEPTVDVTLYTAFAKGDKTELIVQKAVELGAKALCLFPSERCVAKYDGKTLGKKLERWNRIALEAAKQSGRGEIPQVRAAASYRTAMDEAAELDHPLFFYEAENQLSLREVLDSRPDGRSAALVTGPEGGFSPDEVSYAQDRGLAVVTLGKRILRCETAPLAALAAVMYATGNFE